MRRWGVLITAFYFLLLLVLFGPVLLALAGDVDSSPTNFRSLSSPGAMLAFFDPRHLVHASAQELHKGAFTTYAEHNAV